MHQYFILLTSLLSASARATPDLSVTELSECTDSGGSELWVEVTNSGTTAIAYAWIDVFIGRAAPPLMGEYGDFFTHTDSLSPGASGWYEVYLGSPSGADWVDVIVNTDRLVAESDYSDNAAYLWGEFDSCDLVEIDVQSMSTPPSACRGEDLAGELELTLRNTGPADITGAFYVSWYLSSDTLLDGSDRLLVGGIDAVNMLPSGVSSAVETSDNQIPSDAALGARYLIASIDSSELVTESDEENNVVSSPISIGDCLVDVASISAGRHGSCALTDSGAIRCWGSSDSGLLGYGRVDIIGDDEAPEVEGDIRVGGLAEGIAVGGTHSCALLETGSVRCWGDNSVGQLGYGHTNDIGDNELPSSVGVVDIGGTAIQIATGFYHTCALLDTGSVRCWGLNNYGQLGYGHINKIGDDELPAAVGVVDIGGTAVQIATGGYYTCALLDTGSVRCWGDNEYGQLGYGHTNNIGDNELPSSAGSVSIGGSATQISAGYGFTCALLGAGSVRCWGENRYGQLGYGHTNNIGDNELPTATGLVNLKGTALQVSAGYEHVCARVEGGALHCWGNNGYGQLGYGHTRSIGDNETPASAGSVSLGGLATQVSTGLEHTCALLDTGSVRCWGSGILGALGYGNRSNIGDNETPASAGDIPLF